MDTDLKVVDTDHIGDTDLSGMDTHVSGMDTLVSGMDTHLSGMYVVWIQTTLVIQTSVVWIHTSLVCLWCGYRPQRCGYTSQWYGYRPLSGMDTEVYGEGWHPPVLNQQRRRNQSQPSMHVICNNYEERSPT